MRKIAVVITARASYSRIKTALLAMRDHPGIDLRVILAGSALLDRYGAIEGTLKADGLAVAERVHMVLEGETPLCMSKTTGLGMIEFATAFENMKPDAAVVIADRHEVLAAAAAAAYQNIPLVHVQGGEVTGSIDDKVRNAITMLADWHFAATTKAGFRIERLHDARRVVGKVEIHVTGCPSIDLAAQVKPMDFEPSRKYGGVGANIQFANVPYIVVLQHPVTTEYAEAFEQAKETLYAVQEMAVATAWFWPNVDAGSDGTSHAIRQFREKEKPQTFRFFKNFSPEDFLSFVNGAQCIVGNSSVAIRECSYLGVPAVNIGTRQQGRERGPNVVDVPHERGRIRAAIFGQMVEGRKPKSMLYGDGKAGPRIAELLSSVDLRNSLDVGATLREIA